MGRCMPSWATGSDRQEGWRPLTPVIGICLRRLSSGGPVGSSEGIAEPSSAHLTAPALVPLSRSTLGPPPLPTPGPRSCLDTCPPAPLPLVQLPPSPLSTLQPESLLRAQSTPLGFPGPSGAERGDGGARGWGRGGSQCVMGTASQSRGMKRSGAGQRWQQHTRATVLQKPTAFLPGSPPDPLLGLTSAST